jgi:hypothetical protein
MPQRSYSQKLAHLVIDKAKDLLMDKAPLRTRTP